MVRRLLSCDFCPARSLGFCGRQTKGTLDLLRMGGSIGEAQARDILKTEGSVAASIHLIVSGAVMMTKQRPDGSQQIVGLRFAGDFLGWPYTNTYALGARAITTLTYCRFERADFERLLDERPELQRQMIQHLQSALDDACSWQLWLASKSAYVRVASLLEFVAHRSVRPRKGQPGEHRFVLELTRQEMADCLGLCVETVSRQVGALKNDNIVQLEAEHIMIVLDMAQLRSAAGLIADDSQARHRVAH